MPPPDLPAPLKKEAETETTQVGERVASPTSERFARLALVAQVWSAAKNADALVRVRNLKPLEVQNAAAWTIQRRFRKRKEASTRIQSWVFKVFILFSFAYAFQRFFMGHLPSTETTLVKPMRVHTTGGDVAKLPGRAEDTCGGAHIPIAPENISLYAGQPLSVPVAGREGLVDDGTNNDGYSHSRTTTTTTTTTMTIAWFATPEGQCDGATPPTPTVAEKLSISNDAWPLLSSSTSSTVGSQLTVVSKLSKNTDANSRRNTNTSPPFSSPSGDRGAFVPSIPPPPPPPPPSHSFSSSSPPPTTTTTMATQQQLGDGIISGDELKNCRTPRSSMPPPHFPVPHEKEAEAETTQVEASAASPTTELFARLFNLSCQRTDDRRSLSLFPSSLLALGAPTGDNGNPQTVGLSSSPSPLPDAEKAQAQAASIAVEKARAEAVSIAAEEPAQAVCAPWWAAKMNLFRFPLFGLLLLSNVSDIALPAGDLFTPGGRVVVTVQYLGLAGSFAAYLVRAPIFTEMDCPLSSIKSNSGGACFSPLQYVAHDFAILQVRQGVCANQKLVVNVSGQKSLKFLACAHPSLMSINPSFSWGANATLPGLNFSLGADFEIALSERGGVYFNHVGALVNKRADGGGRNASLSEAYFSGTESVLSSPRKLLIEGTEIVFALKCFLPPWLGLKVVLNQSSKPSFAANASQQLSVGYHAPTETIAETTTTTTTTTEAFAKGIVAAAENEEKANATSIMPLSAAVLPAVSNIDDKNNGDGRISADGDVKGNYGVSIYLQSISFRPLTGLIVFFVLFFGPLFFLRLPLVVALSAPPNDDSDSAGGELSAACGDGGKLSGGDGGGDESRNQGGSGRDSTESNKDPPSTSSTESDNGCSSSSLTVAARATKEARKARASKEAREARAAKEAALASLASFAARAASVASCLSFSSKGSKSLCHNHRQVARRGNVDGGELYDGGELSNISGDGGGDGTRNQGCSGRDSPESNKSPSSTSSTGSDVGCSSSSLTIAAWKARDAKEARAPSVASCLSFSSKGSKNLSRNHRQVARRDNVDGGELSDGGGYGGELSDGGGEGGGDGSRNQGGSGRDSPESNNSPSSASSTGSENGCSSSSFTIAARKARAAKEARAVSLFQASSSSSAEDPREKYQGVRDDRKRGRNTGQALASAAAAAAAATRDGDGDGDDDDDGSSDDGAGGLTARRSSRLAHRNKSDDDAGDVNSEDDHDNGEAGSNNEESLQSALPVEKPTPEQLIQAFGRTFRGKSTREQASQLSLVKVTVRMLTTKSKKWQMDPISYVPPQPKPWQADAADLDALKKKIVEFLRTNGMTEPYSKWCFPKQKGIPKMMAWFGGFSEEVVERDRKK